MKSVNASIVPVTTDMSRVSSRNLPIPLCGPKHKKRKAEDIPSTTLNVPKKVVNLDSIQFDDDEEIWDWFLSQPAWKLTLPPGWVYARK